MKIIIDIPQEMHDQIMDGYVPLGISKYLKNGTILAETGHWKKVSFDKYIESAGYHYTCDQCGKFKVGKSNYCPNCGARMESEVSK